MEQGEGAAPSKNFGPCDPNEVYDETYRYCHYVFSVSVDEYYINHKCRCIAYLCLQCRLL